MTDPLIAALLAAHTEALMREMATPRVGGPDGAGAVALRPARGARDDAAARLSATAIDEQLAKGRP